MESTHFWFSTFWEVLLAALRGEQIFDQSTKNNPHLNVVISWNVREFCTRTKFSTDVIFWSHLICWSTRADLMSKSDPGLLRKWRGNHAIRRESQQITNSVTKSWILWISIGKSRDPLKTHEIRNTNTKQSRTPLKQKRNNHETCWKIKEVRET